MTAWAVGVAVYHLVANNLPSLGASIPGFAVAFLLYLALVRVGLPAWQDATQRTKG